MNNEKFFEYQQKSHDFYLAENQKMEQRIIDKIDERIVPLEKRVTLLEKCCTYVVGFGAGIAAWMKYGGRQ